MIDIRQATDVARRVSGAREATVIQQTTGYVVFDAGQCLVTTSCARISDKAVA